MIVLILAILGILDSAYLAYEHFSNIIPPCPVHSVLGRFVDCGRVLQSSYATVFGVPLALIGLGYYLFLILINFKFPKLMPIIVTLALGASIYFLYLQIFVIHAICVYCTLSGLINLLVFLNVWYKLTHLWFQSEKK